MRFIPSLPRPPMSFIRPRFWCLLLMPALALGQERLPPEFVTEERNKAVGYAIGLDLITHQLTRSCAAYGGDAQSLTRSGRTAWQGRNNEWVGLAHRYLEAVRDQISAVEGSAAGQRYYDERKAELQRESQAFLERHFASGTTAVPGVGGGVDAFDTCRSLAAELGTGDFDLTQHAEHAAVMRALKLVLPPPAR
jgi:hypothetical protein